MARFDLRSTALHLDPYSNHIVCMCYTRNVPGVCQVGSWARPVHISHLLTNMCQQTGVSLSACRLVLWEWDVAPW